MFAVSRCPTCKRLHGLELPVDRTGCRLCGRRYSPAKGSIVRTFNTEAEMRAFLQGASSIDGGSDLPIVDIGGYSKKIKPSAARPGKSRMIKLVIAELMKGPRSWSDLVPLCEDTGSPELLEDCLSALMEEGTIFLGKDRRYSLVV